jgi:TonB-linked SusC/RagA family outer membrane protein
MKRWLLLRRKSASSPHEDAGHLFRVPHLFLVFFLSLLSFLAFAQQRVTGKVVAGNSPVAGATVAVKNSATATQTNENGEFTINAPANSTLVISSVGFSTQEIKLGTNSNISVQLQSSANTMEDVVVVGYGTQRKATMTGSVSQVSGTQIAKSPAANVTASLQGRLPGLTAIQRNGQPGRDDANLLIRGGGTLNDNSPLIIIDGVQRSLIGRLNPEDIESISVLKDASAAIYGARGANGVILVTTKSGSKGKADFTFTYKRALSEPTKIPDVLDAATFAEVYNEGAYYRSGRNPNYWNNPQYSAATIQKFRDGSDPILFPNTDWVGLVLKDKPAYQENLNLQVNGGSNNVRYLLSFGTLSQNGNFVADPTFYRQYNGRVKVDIDLLKNLVVGANLSAIFNNRTFSPVGGNTNFVNILQANPTLVGRYPNGLIGPGRLGENPLLMDQRGYDKIFDNPIYSTFTASYKIPFVPGLKVDGSYNYDFSSQFQKTWSLPYTFHEYNTVTQTYDVKKGTGQAAASLTDAYRRYTTQMYNLRLSYDKIFLADHHIAAMVGFEQQQVKNSDVSATRRNFLSTALDQLNVGSTAPEDQSIGGGASNDAYDNYFGRVNYDFKSRYLFEFLFRYDGSPRFREGKRFGFFPGVMAAWRLSEEKFFRDAVSFVDQLKLRASYAELGNDRIGAFQYYQFYGFGGNYVFGNSIAPGLTTQTLPNPNVTWELAKKLDFGLEASLWNGKLGIDLTYWQQKRTDILIARNLAIPATMGFPGVPPENFAKVNSSGIELILSHRSRFGQFNYNVSGNVAYNKSEIIEQDEVPPAEAYQKITGMPIGSGLYYKADGIYNTIEELNDPKYPHHANTQLGDIKVLDLNSDGKINDKDRYRVPYSSQPRYVFGLNNDLQYKNFDLNVFFQGQAGARVYFGDAAALGGTDFANSSVWRATDRWTEANPNGTKPRADMWQPGNTTFFFFNAAFVRLKTIELGYNIPNSILQKTKAIKNLRVFVSAFNLATWAKEITFADPELNGSYLVWPQQRVINFGGSIKF